MTSFSQDLPQKSFMAVYNFLEIYPLQATSGHDRQEHQSRQKFGKVFLPLWQQTYYLDQWTQHWDAYIELLLALRLVLSKCDAGLKTWVPEFLKKKKRRKSLCSIHEIVQTQLSICNPKSHYLCQFCHISRTISSALNACTWLRIWIWSVLFLDLRMERIGLRWLCSLEMQRWWLDR